MTPRLITFDDPEPVNLDGLDPSTRYRRRHPDRIKARNEKWRKENPHYGRDYYRRKIKAAA